jgi:hypothetical protein
MEALTSRTSAMLTGIISRDFHFGFIQRATYLKVPDLDHFTSSFDCNLNLTP